MNGRSGVYRLFKRLAGPGLLLLAVGAQARTAYQPTIHQSNGRIANQHVFHFHLHVIPRYADDPLRGRGAPLSLAWENLLTAIRQPASRSREIPGRRTTPPRRLVRRAEWIRSSAPNPIVRRASECRRRSPLCLARRGR